MSRGVPWADSLTKTGRPVGVPFHLCSVPPLPLYGSGTRDTRDIGGLDMTSTLHHRPCGQPTLAALTGDRCGYVVRVDPAPLSAFGEVGALRDGRSTYLARGRYLEPRDGWTIRGNPPGLLHPVHAEHRCGELIPAAWVLPPPPTVHRPAESKEIPF